MTTQIEKLPAKTYKLTLTIPQDEVNRAFQTALTALTSHIKLDGFRPGMAPTNLTEGKIDEGKLNGEVVNILIPSAVSNAIKEHHLKPIVSPKTILKQLEKDKDCIVETTIIEYPEIVLGDYKAAISNNPKTPNTPSKSPEITKPLLDTTKIEISQSLIEEEVSRMFMQLMDQTAKLGITIDEYLRSINKTLDEIKQDYKKTSEDNLKLEFILNEIAKKENITVSDSEIQAAIDASPDAKTKEEFSKEENKWYIRSVLLKSKVITNLTNLTNSPN